MKKTMTELGTEAFRTVGPGDAIPNDFVVPYYLEDRKLRISVARVDDLLYAFDDLCTCAEQPCRFLEVCSPDARSCANATARSGTSLPGQYSTVLRPSR